MLKKLLKNIRGDTLVEVLLASVILSVVLAGAYGLSTRATRINQSSYERTVASNLVREQAELLRAARDADGDIWTLISAKQPAVYYDCRVASASVNPETSDSDNQRIFHLSTASSNGESLSIELVDRQTKPTDGIYYTWVTKKATPSTDDYFDFYVYTCWQGLGGIGNQVSGTVIRLEWPR